MFISKMNIFKGVRRPTVRLLTGFGSIMSLAGTAVRVQEGLCMACEIQLTNGKVVILDDEDFAWASKRRWSEGPGGCAVDEDGSLMHRLVMGADVGELVQHRNWDRLDNRRQNLVVTTYPAVKRWYYEKEAIRQAAREEA